MRTCFSSFRDPSEVWGLRTTYPDARIMALLEASPITCSKPELGKRWNWGLQMEKAPDF